LKTLIVGVTAATAALVAASTLGIAAAEGPSSSSASRTVSVEGVASAPIAQDADQTAANAAYHQAMGLAESDGREKAELLANKAGATAGSVQSIAEGGGTIECGKLTAEGSDVQYEGAIPDFGNGESHLLGALAAQPRGAASSPTAKRHPSKKNGSKGHAAHSFTCTLSAQVALVYPLS